MNIKMRKIDQGSVTSPRGFLASGMHAGIKSNRRKFDCALIISETPAVSAGMFTVNKMKAWPLLYNEKIILKRSHRAVLANSGNANCFNGKSGEAAVALSSEQLSKTLKVGKDEILLASTGIIGKPFPVKRIEKVIPMLVENLSRHGGHHAARGILTTDTCPKETAVRFRLDGQTVTLGGMAKGAGMVYPHLERPRQRHATMLCFLTTDIAISKSMLQKAVASAAARTFNHVAIDNDMSTNDMVLILANGFARNRRITGPGRSFNLFQDALIDVCAYLARAMVKDGEGARHLCEIRIKGARNETDAKLAGRRIATSMLFKTMLAGEDPNWGRLVACVGASGVDCAKSLDIAFDGIFILRNGKESKGCRSRVRQVLRKKEFTLEVDLKKGSAEACFLTADLTKFYVWINSKLS